MGRGSNSQTASDKRFYATQREGFRRIAEQAEKASFRSVRNRNIAETARAAEALVGTQRARDLLENKSLKALKDELEKAYGIITPSVISDIESAIEAAMANKPINYPLGSSYSRAEWLGAAEAIQDYNSYLHGYGYSDGEIAAALAYGRYLVRGNADSRGKSSNMVTTYRNGKPEQVPRYFKDKAFGNTYTKNTYTTKQFVPYTGIIVPAQTMTYASGRSNTEVYKIADIHSGENGAWLQGVNNGNGFAARVHKDKNGWYMEHSRLGHTDSNGEWTERVYLEDLRKRIGF